MLESLLPDVAYACGGVLADGITTYVAVQRTGIQHETNDALREGMIAQGTRHLVKDTLIRLAHAPVFGGLTFGIDYLLGQEAETLNFHHVLLYGFGSLSYVAGLANTLYVAGESCKRKGWSRLAKIFECLWYIPIMPVLAVNSVVKMGERVVRQTLNG
ncbi:hypothetical protein HY490_01280 [Candidatus Woesearchaeota archaeon]|nr:hypothetical protein [Candidatus Woesearchaeota archaeon]